MKAHWNIVLVFVLFVAFGSADDLRAQPPTISSFSPPSGPAGTPLTINGTHFSPIPSDNIVKIGLAIAPVSVATVSSIVVTVPSAATSGPITVTTPQGTTTSPTNFTVLPQIDDFFPLSGPAGTIVKIHGSAFTGATSVRFNGTPASFTVDSSTQVTATVPSAAVSGTISIQTPDGIASSSTPFGINIPPVISFSAPQYYVREESLAAAITIVRAGNTNDTLSVRYRTSDGTAIAGMDYATTSGVFFFGSGVTSQTFVVPVNDDSLIEGNETVNLTLSVSSGSGLVVLGTGTLTIIDNDSVGPPILQVDSFVDFGSVQVGQQATRTVNINNPGGMPLVFTLPTLVFGSDSGFSIISQPATLTLNPGQGTSYTVGFHPTFQSYRPFVGLMSIASNAGSASALLAGFCPDTTHPGAQLLNPVGGEIFNAGTQISINFTGTDNDLLTGFIISYSTDGGTSFDHEIARRGPSIGQVVWNIPDFLSTTQGRIRVVVMDRSGNSASATSGTFTVHGPPMPLTALHVAITFDPPPPGQIAPPQNVRANASELNIGGGNPPRAFGYTRKDRSSVVGSDVLGYNVYRVPKPPDPLPIPTAEEIVGDSSNLIGSIPADSLGFSDLLSLDRGDLFVYSMTSFYEDGSMSGGSPPALTLYMQALIDSAHGWKGPLDNSNAPWYPYPSVDAGKLAVTTVVPLGSPDSNRSMMFNVRNRGTNFASFMKHFGTIPRPFTLTGIEARLKKVGSSPIVSFYVDMVYGGHTYSSGTQSLTNPNWNTLTLGVGGIPNSSTADTIVFGFGGYGDSCKVYVDYLRFLGTGGYIFDVMGDTVLPPSYVTISPDTMLAKDSKGKFLKPVRHGKKLNPNWANLMDEVVAQGGFQPGASESDSAGGMRIGMSYMARSSPDPLAPKWKPIKDSAKVYGWVRLTKWDFKKSIGKNFNYLQKTLEDKLIRHTGDPRGLDSTGVSGEAKRKPLIKQLTKLSPKKQSNKLYAELVALKLNIAASQLGKTPNGFGELIYDVDGSLCDEMPLVDISEKADSMMTYWRGVDSTHYAQLYQALYDINRAFVCVLDTISFDSEVGLKLKGAVPLADRPFLKSGSTHPRLLYPTTTLTESEEDFEDDEFDDGETTPGAAKLYQNYPNPFNPSTTISFRLREPSLVTLRVHNILGQEIATLLHAEEMESGYQRVEFAAGRLASGVYFYEIDAQDLEGAFNRTIETHKMILLK